MSDTIRPLSALTLLGKKHRREGSHVTADCPSCRGTLYVTETSFICEQPNCEFSRGGPEDLLASYLGSYEAAITLLGEHYPEYQLRAEEEVLTLRKRRALLEFGLDAARQNLSPDVERVRLRHAFESARNISSRTNSRGHWFLTTQQSNKLVLLLALLDVTPPSNLQGRPAVVATFWKNQHALSALYVVSDSMKSVRECQIQPSRCSWFGLPQMHPHTQGVDIFEDYTQALENEERFRACNSYRFPTQIHVDPKAPADYERFPSMCFHGGDSVWERRIPLWSYIDGFEKAKFEDAVHGEQTLTALMLRLLKTHLQARSFDIFIDLCSAMRMDTHLRSVLAECARQLPDAYQAQQLMKALSRRLLGKDANGYKIYEEAAGYEMLIKGVTHKITNFTLEFSAVTVFSQLSDQLYTGCAYVGGKPLDFELPSQRVEDPNQFEKALQNNQALQPGGSEADYVLIHDKPKFKRVMEILRQQLVKLPRHRGFMQLGWNHQHDLFITPMALVDIAGIQGGVRYHADDVGDHKCYSSATPLPDPLPASVRIDPRLAELLSALVAQTIRYYHSLPVRLFPLENNVKTQKAALRLFRGLGQTSPFRLRSENGISPRNLGRNRGMPCLVVGMSQLQGENVEMAGAWVAERGLDLACYSDDQIEEAGRILPALILEVSRRLLRPDGLKFERQRSVRKLSAMAEEGAAVIRREFWDDWPRASQHWRPIDTLLGEHEKLFKKQAVLDSKHDLVILNSPLWVDKDFDKDDLLIALGLLCAQVKAEEDKITVDRSSMYVLCSEFYGSVPRLATA